jgi:tripartite-type tricarboxylate transporter receptor subunit TctC
MAMTMKVRAALAALTLAIAAPAYAQDFPTRSMTMVIPFAACGPTDVLGRVIPSQLAVFTILRNSRVQPCLVFRVLAPLVLCKF